MLAEYLSYEFIALFMFITMLVMMFTGQRVFGAIGFVAAASALLIWGEGSMEMPYTATWKLFKWYPMLTLPLFIYMGFMISESGIANDLYKMFHVLFGGVKGGLAIGTMFMMVAISAMNGLSVAGMAIGATIALPEMLRRNYDKRMITGVVQAGSSLGILIPPSVVMVLYGMIARQPVSKLWMAGILPGLLMAFLFLIYIYIRCKLQPELGPPLKKEERSVSTIEKIRLLKAGIIPFLIFFFMTGLFLMGIGPLLSWNYTSKCVLLNRFKLPLSVSFLSGIGYMIFSSSFQIYVFVAIMGVSFTLSSILGEFYKSYKKQKKASNILHSIGKMFLSNRHKNGGYIVHIGIVLLFIGFIGRAFEVEKEFSLSPGEQIYFSNYVFKLNSIKSEARDNHYAFLSEIDVVDSSTNKLLVNLKPEKRIYFYWNSDPEKRQPHSELDIYSTIQKDIYSIFSGYDAQKNIGYFKIMINPLVNWVWIGGVLMVIGSLFAFWPSRRDN